MKLKSISVTKREPPQVDTMSTEDAFEFLKTKNWSPGTRVAAVIEHYDDSVAVVAWHAGGLCTLNATINKATFKDKQPCKRYSLYDLKLDTPELNLDEL